MSWTVRLRLQTSESSSNLSVRAEILDPDAASERTLKKFERSASVMAVGGTSEMLSFAQSNTLAPYVLVKDNRTYATCKEMNKKF